VIAATRRPPRLVVKALTVTFVTVTALLLVVFLLVRMTIRDQVRQTIADNLDVSQRTVAALERRRQHELRMQAATLAESPTLKAAVDIYAAEGASDDANKQGQLIATIKRELDKVAARVEADAIVLVDAHGMTLAAAGPAANRWPRGRPMAPAARRDTVEDFDSVAQSGGEAFRVVTVPLLLNEGVAIGSLHLATALDRRFAEHLDRMSRARTAIVADGVVVATTLSPRAAREFETALAHAAGDVGSIDLDGASHAYLRLAVSGPASVYAISSIDDAAAVAMRRANQSLVGIGLGAIALALLGSAWLAKVLTDPIERLSTSLATLA